MTETMDVAAALEMLKMRHEPPPKDPNKQYPYQLVHFDDLRPGRRSPWIVDDLIPIDGLVAVWGPPKSGKSFWTFDLAMHVALGWPYRGRRVERQGPVVYCAFEGADGFHARAEAFRRTHEIKDRAWFYLLASNAKLVRDHKALIQSMYEQTGMPPTFVVLDTLNRSIDGSENKDEDMGAYIAAADAICEEFLCAVIIVHHCGIDGTRPRGHTSLSGAASVQIAIRRDAAHNVVAEVEAMKDGPEGASFTSQLQLIEVGTEDNGKAITSCAIVPVDGATSKPKRKLSDTSQFGLDLLVNLISDKTTGLAAPTDLGFPPGTRVTRAGTWRTRFIDDYQAIEDRENRGRTFRRVYGDLNKQKVIGVKGEYVWLTSDLPNKPDKPDK